VADYDRFYPFLVGGRSFARALRARAVTPEFLKRFESEATAIFTEAAWHGVGRALWFRSAANPKSLTEALLAYPPATTALTFGLGVAMTFTQIATPAAVARSMASMPERFRANLMIGGSLTLLAMINESPGEEHRIRSLHAGGLVSRLDAAVAAMAGLPFDADWYAAFLDRLTHASSSVPALSKTS
jgi:hypothetical protein